MHALLLEDLVREIERERVRAARRPSVPSRSVRRTTGDALVSLGERLGGRSKSGPAVSPRSDARAPVFGG